MVIPVQELWRFHYCAGKAKTTRYHQWISTPQSASKHARHMSMLWTQYVLSVCTTSPVLLYRPFGMGGRDKTATLYLVLQTFGRRWSFEIEVIYRRGYSIALRKSFQCERGVTKTEKGHEWGRCFVSIQVFINRAINKAQLLGVYSKVHSIDKAVSFGWMI